jgi:hypothetical protein
VRLIKKDEPALKFGQIIGFANQDIAPAIGCMNIISAFMPSTATISSKWTPATPRRFPARPFQGFRRANGKFGTRNYLGILTSVNCSATVAAADRARSGKKRLAGRVSRSRWRDPAGAWPWLRHGQQGRGLRV